MNGNKRSRTYAFLQMHNSRLHLFGSSTNEQNELARRNKCCKAPRAEKQQSGWKRGEPASETQTDVLLLANHRFSPTVSRPALLLAFEMSLQRASSWWQHTKVAQFRPLDARVHTAAYAIHWWGWWAMTSQWRLNRFTWKLQIPKSTCLRFT